MSNVNLAEISQSILPILTHFKPNKPSEDQIGIAPDLEEIRQKVEDILKVQVENLRSKDDNYVDAYEEETDVDDNYTQIIKFYEDISAKLEMVDPLDRPIYSHDYEDQKWIQ